MPARPQPSADHASQLTLGELVARSGVPASTVHHYRRLGLLPGPATDERHNFVYGEEHIVALRVIRELREERSMPLAQIREVLPALLHGDEAPDCASSASDARKRLLGAAFELFSGPGGYASVTVSEIAAAAGVAKGSVYRHFPSKEALFTAVVEDLCSATAASFAQSVQDLGGATGVEGDPQKTAMVFGRHITRAMPILLELGARAARGDLPSQVLAARVLRTLAEAAGEPLRPGEEASETVPAGLSVIETAFSTVLKWATGPDWAFRS